MDNDDEVTAHLLMEEETDIAHLFLVYGNLVFLLQNTVCSMGVKIGVTHSEHTATKRKDIFTC